MITVVPSRESNPGNPRVARTRAKVLSVARRLLPEVGIDGLSYSLLAQQAGVTRQTLYRHWPTRGALLFDVILQGPEVGYPDQGADVRTVAVAWLRSLRAGLGDPATRAAVLAVTAKADHDRECADALIGIGEDRRAALNGLLLPSGRQLTADQYTLLYSPVMARLLLELREVTDDFIDTVVDQWLAAL